MDSVSLLRIINIFMALWGVLLALMLNRRYPGIWVYLFPAILWLVHTIVFQMAVIAWTVGYIDMIALAINAWSSLLRMQAIASIVLVFTVLMLRSEDA